MADLVTVAADVALQNETDSLRKLIAEACVAGQVAYLDGNDSVQLSVATDALKDSPVGVILLGGAIGEYALIAPEGSEIDLGVSLTQGETYIISDTAGAIRPIGDLSTGEYSTKIGHAKDSDTFLVRIDVIGVTRA